MFIKECIIKNLVSQKKDISRQKVLLEKVAEQEENERQAARLEARERVYTEFEASQQSVSSANKPRNNNSMAADQKSTTTTALSSSGIKFNSTELDRLTKENEDAALAKIQAEQNEKRKSRLPNFWLVCHIRFPATSSIISIFGRSHYTLFYVYVLSTI